MEEDVAYSLIGIFKSDIRPQYGEGEAAPGHLLEEIVARSGEVRVLSWAGKSSSYNSCLATTLAVYSQTLYVPPAIDDAEMDVRVGASKIALSQEDVMIFHDQVNRLPPARFANRRLHLPCVRFVVKKAWSTGFREWSRAPLPCSGIRDWLRGIPDVGQALVDGATLACFRASMDSRSTRSTGCVHLGRCIGW